MAAAPFATPHPEAVDEALAGVRAGLSQAAALQDGGGYPRVVVEVLRVDELPVDLAGASAGTTRLPLARGSGVGVVGRAWILAAPGAAPIDDTGDVRRVDHVAQSSEALESAYAYGSAVRSAARRVGEALARRILGAAEPGTDPM